MEIGKFLRSVGGRKLTACLIAFVATIAFFAVSRLSEPGFIGLIKFILVVYIGGNVATDVAEVFKKPEQK